jgi:general secretion pathway protein D
MTINHMKIRTLTGLFVLMIFASGCVSYRAYERGRELQTMKKWDEAVEQYAKALEMDPQNQKYVAALMNARLEASRAHFERGKALMAAGQPEMAALELELTVKLDPTNQFALVELHKAAQAVKARQASSQPMTIDEKKARARGVTKMQPPQLDPASDEPISLSFPRETPVKEIYRALGNAFGINILFDAQVKDDPIAIELRDVTAQAAIERVMQAAGHFYKVLDERSLIIVPDNPQARREYEDLVIQTFYLSNGDAEQVSNVLRTMLEARNVFPLKALNAITIRDTADRVRIAQEIIEANDKARAEVVVSVELLQMDVNKLRDVGMQIVGLGLGSINAIDGNGDTITGITLDAFRNLGSNDFAFTMPSIAYNFLKSNSEAQVLARPQLRISEGETATLHIGRRVPLPVSTFTSANPTQGGTFAPVTSYTYNDVGIKIALEPRVHHNREVTLKLKVEVSGIDGDAPGTNPPQPIIGTRTIESVIRLKDGETNFLAGLIREDDTITRNSTPFLGDLPLIGRLFSSDSTRFQRTDLMLTMTPHIIRIANIEENDLVPMWVGTGTNMTFRGASPRIESQINVDPFSAPPSQFTPPPPVPQTSDEPFVNVPPASGPTDIFAPRQPLPSPTPPPPMNEPPEVQTPRSRNPATYVPPDGGGMASLTLPEEFLSLAAASSSERFTPRIAPQPGRLELQTGAEGLVNVIGMDIEGLQMPELRIHFSPRSLSVLEAVPGEALAVDNSNPPLVTVDAIGGIVTVRTMDGSPIRFTGGGTIIRLAIRGDIAGESYLVLDSQPIREANGTAVDAVIHGGRIVVR